MKNALLEQYGIHKLTELRLSPYSCLIDSNIEQTPHQVEAFIAALKALKTGGIILADEVGLGKTIEAGLVIKYLIKDGAKRILIAMPPPLRKQWQDELEEKFNLKTIIPESKYSIQNRDEYKWKKLTNDDEPLIVITSYGFTPWFVKHFKNVKWDCFIFDEAHRLRNYGTGTKMPKAIFDATRYVPKIMLTATPLQNNLRELYALSQFIDERIFISEKVFNNMFVIPEDYKGLRKAIAPILHRTLRKDVAEYIFFSKRDCMPVDFKLNREEAILYQLANDYLQRPVLHAVSTKNNALVKMVVRKLLASSSYAVVETFEVLKKRLKILKENTRVVKADISLQAFFNLIDDDGDDATGEEPEDDDIQAIERERYREEINNELTVVEDIIKMAVQVKSNSKSDAVITALKLAFEYQRKMGFSEKALIFTESKRTQKYLVESLLSAGFDGIIVFNGEMNDPETKKIYNAWKTRNPKRVTNTPSVDMKQAIVEQFKNEAKILIATDVASEGLNLQFCDTVINYDLPWNPMKIEQRIGRCHRFGQKRDVWVYNLLNRENAADARVYDILEHKFNLFKGVFGASDEALGLLESGSNFEKKVMAIYEHCKSPAQFKREFDRLESEITAKRNKKQNELKHVLQAITSAEKRKHLAFTAEKLKTWIEETAKWSEIAKETKPVKNSIMQISNANLTFDGKTVFHGYIFVGALTKSTNEFVQPILAAFDNNGIMLKYNSNEIEQAFKPIQNSAFAAYKPDNVEMQLINTCFDKITPAMIVEYQKKNKQIIDQNDIRINNWEENQSGQYKAESDELSTLINALTTQKNISKHFQEKIEIQKKIDKYKKEQNKRDENYHSAMLAVKNQAEEARNMFNAQFQIDPNCACQSNC
ncbi:MAG: DISARM system SNF2-like helicase DrmD [Treponema sp.]|nr:DISARM system SNF2-like helicase DrmD [Treponema sp.]